MKQFLKNFAKRVFLSGFLQVPSPKACSRTMADLLAHVRRLGFQPRTVIDVGVAHGTPALYQAFPGARHLLVEPLREFEESLQRICRQYQAEYVLAAAGDRPGTITILVRAEALTASTLFAESDGSAVDGSPRQVPTLTLDDFCRERQARGPYLIKVDVQGAELLVMTGARQLLPETELVLLEVSLFQFYQGGPQFFEVVNFMKDLGFVVYDFFDAHHRLIDGALAQLDVAFVKESGMFRRHHFYASQGQRQKLKKVYQWLSRWKSWKDRRRK